MLKQLHILGYLVYLYWYANYKGGNSSIKSVAMIVKDQGNYRQGFKNNTLESLNDVRKFVNFILLAINTIYDSDDNDNLLGLVLQSSWPSPSKLF